MAKVLLLPILLSFLILFNACLAQYQPGQRRQQRQRGTQFSQQNECQINNLDALEPDNRIEAEAGVTEVWDHTHEQFQCAGVAFIRRRLERNALLLPSFTNVPQLVYVVRGQGYFGAVLSGCPETFQESQEEMGQYQVGQGQQGEFEDQHQKIRHFRQGDTIALPAGVSYWYYNSGEEPLVVVALLDTTNFNNQLDRTPRKFFLAGNPEQEFEEQGQQGQRGQRGQRRSRRFQPGREERSQCNNLFCGFDEELLAEAFNVDPEIIRRLQNEEDNRGNIVRVEGRLEVTMPPMRRQSEHGGSERRRRGERESERERGRGRSYGSDNGLEETYCSMRLRENIGDPSRADVFVPRAGRISTINSHNLPILGFLRLSAEHGVLYRNAIMVPHWNVNAHSIVYVTRGRARIQVVDHNGNSVFDDELEEGQVLTIPQNFAVLKRAMDEGFEWISFKTNDNAMINPLVGRTSAIRGIPSDVLSNAFQDLSKEDVQRLKNNRRETTMLSPSERSMRGRRNE